MAKIKHKTLSQNDTDEGKGIHVQLSIPDFADETERLAFSQSAKHRGAQAWQLSDGTTWQADGAGGWKEIGAAGGGGGEVNTASNSGAGAGLAQAKSGVDLPFKSLTGGTGVTLTPTADEIDIAVDYGTAAGTAAQGDDTRIPAQTENNALVGTSGVPGSANKYVTDSDPRMSDGRNDADAIHDNVAGEITAIAAATVAGADILLIEDADDSNNKKRTTAQAIADLAGGGTPYSSVALKTEANDGQVLDSDTMNINFGAADFGMKLPPTAGLAVGHREYVMAAGTKRLVITVDNVGTEGILGLGATVTVNNVATYGVLSAYIFEYLGTGLGQPLWLAVSRTKDDAKAPHSPVRWATVEALPAYTESGSGKDRVLTGNANGQLRIDGVDVIVSPVDRSGLLLKDEIGGNQGNHGIWQVIQPGVDGVSPFILRQRPDWFENEGVKIGAVVPVAEGRANASKSFLLKDDQNVGSPVVLKEARAVGTGDEGIDESKSTVGALSATFFVAMPDNDTVAMVAVRLLGQDDTSNDLNRYVDELTIKRNGAGTITQASEVLALREDQAAAALSYVVVAGGVNISILGVAARTIEWRCVADITRLTLGGG